MIKQATRTFLALLVVPIILGCDCCDPEPPIIVIDSARKVAVLAPAFEATKDDEKYNSDFWYDLVLNYCTLLDHGFESDDIFVLYGDGSDATFSIYPAYVKPYCGTTDIEKITDFSFENSTGLAKDNLCNVLCCLSTGHPATLNGTTCECDEDSATGIGGFTCTGDDYSIPKLAEQDFLFTWIRGHGNAWDCNDVTLSFDPPNPLLGNKELGNLVAGIKDNRKAMIFETCDAGGWLGDLQNINTAVTTSSAHPAATGDCREKSWIATYDELPGDELGIFHGRFTHALISALRKLDSTTVPIDNDGNNLVSIREGFDEAARRVEAENTIIKQLPPPPEAADFVDVMNPAIGTPDDIAPCLFIRLPHPGKDHEVFTKDHENDDAIVPSNGGSAESPDLWVSQSDTGSPKTTSVKKGETFFLFVQAHNIGCADLTTVKVKHSVTKADATGPVHPLPDGGPATISVGDSSIIKTKWQVGEDFANNDYFLIAELSVTGDSAAADLPVAGDNNKAQITITFED